SGNRTQVQQVLFNLIVNAIHAVGTAGHIDIYADKAEGGVDFRVVDDGTGMDSTTLAKVFDPFFTTKPVGAGTGLGLSICRTIIENHGGTIGAISQLGKGSTFRVHLPTRTQVDDKEDNDPSRG